MNNNNQLIPSKVYKSTIETLCKPLHKMCNIQNFVAYIIFNDGKQFVLSNMSDNFLNHYHFDKYHQYDYSAKNQSFGDLDYYLCDDILAAEPIFQETCQEKFKLFRTFYITRKSPECRLVFGAINDHHVINQPHLYKTSISNFEDFCVQFLDGMIDIIKSHNSSYKRAIILNDKFYRRSIIKNLYDFEEKLTEREIECIYWAAHGKSSEETAMILKIKSSTVEEYRKNIKKKLNCSNIAQAVYESIKRGYIGAFSKTLAV